MAYWIKNIFRKKKNTENIPLLNVDKIFSYDEYNLHTEKHPDDYRSRLLFEKSLLPTTQTEFLFYGYCYVCKKFVKFLVDFNYAYMVDCIIMPNWRERLVCPTCLLNNRTRASIHIFKQECQASRNSKIYICEQTTPLYNWFKSNYSHVYGSEYIGESIPSGGYNEQGIRNEDITRLSFSEAQFDYILSFDVFEHIPNYKDALKQCFRCLKPNGMLMFSVPFVQTAEKNIIRAYINKNGKVTYLLPPEYHGDPLGSGDCLSFYIFGWEILNDLSIIGFKPANALLYWSKEYAYLGMEQIIFTATKPAV